MYPCLSDLLVEIDALVVVISVAVAVVFVVVIVVVVVSSSSIDSISASLEHGNCNESIALQSNGRQSPSVKHLVRVCDPTLSSTL